MRILTKEQINDILTTTVGKRADLSDADLSHMDLSGVDLSGADLSGSLLINANLSDANLENANLCGADMRYAYLFRANLRWTNMCNIRAESAGFNLADLVFTKFNDADLSHAIFNCQTVIHMVNFDHACLDGISGLDSACPIACPETGSFVGWKKVKLSNEDPSIGYVTLDTVIVKLRILEDAKRSSATSRKCRCSAAMVEEIQTLDGLRITPRPDSSFIVHSFHDPNFIYETGKIVSVSDFDDNRWNECSTGIHFFITRQEAVKYQN